MSSTIPALANKTYLANIQQAYELEHIAWTMLKARTTDSVMFAALLNAAAHYRKLAQAAL